MLGWKIIYGLINHASAKEAFEGFVTNARTKIAKGVTGAIRQTAEEIKREARSSIAGGGFSSRWQNALRVNVYPRTGISASAAAYLYHKIPYAGVFETGETITGKPLMWLPTKYALERVSGHKITPKLFSEFMGIKLRPTGNKGGRPMLVADLHLSDRMSKKVLRNDDTKISARTIRKSKDLMGGTTAVPMFVGISTVKEKKLFDILGVVAKARANLTALYHSIVGRS